MAVVKQRFTKKDMQEIADQALRNFTDQSVIDQLPECLKYLRSRKINYTYIGRQLGVSHAAVQYWAERTYKCSDPVHILKIFAIYNSIIEIDKANPSPS